MKLHLSEDLALPADAITQTFGVLAVRGAGKSDLAAVMAEEMFKAGLPFVVVDPVGAWYGLRSSKDGKSSGLSIPIFGGRHGDIPLEKTGGQMIADVAVDQRLSFVLDISEMSEGDKTRFLIDFAERLYRRNRDPLHLFLEEADDFIPQRPFREQARCLRAWENIVRRGRGRGLGITMITQRSAALNKNVLTQIETLFVLRTTSPQDRKAIAAWVEHNGQAKDLLESLQELGPGEAWAWSPSWLKVFKRVQIRRRETFDSGATPKNVTGQRPPATLADVDLGALKVQMAATIERAKGEDPKMLKLRISQLEREVRELKMNPPEAKVERVEVPVPVLTEPMVRQVGLIAERVEAGIRDQIRTLGEFAAQIKRVPHEAAQAYQDRINSSRAVAASNAGRPGHAREETRAADWSRAVIPSTRVPAGGRPAPREGNGRDVAGGAVAKTEQKILNALAWYEALGIEKPTKQQVGVVAGYKVGKGVGGHYGNSLGALRTRGLVSYPTPGIVVLTDEGRRLARDPELPGTAEALQEHVVGLLSETEGKILGVILKIYPSDVRREDVAAQTNYKPEAASGGHFANTLGRLRTLGLVSYPRPGFVKAAPMLFLEGA